MFEKSQKKGRRKWTGKGSGNSLVSGLRAFRLHFGPQVVLELHLEAQSRSNGLQNEAQMDPAWHKMVPRIKIRGQTEAHTHKETQQYIMEAIMHETLKVFNRASEFREVYWTFSRNHHLIPADGVNWSYGLMKPLFWSVIILLGGRGCSLHGFL